MDFGSLLDYAKQNEKPNKEIKCYRTTFAPPKKEPKTKCLSENIQRFLARKEEEEKQKILEANKKREELLALRAQDSKSKKRVSAMLKSTKAANKAVIDDARDDVNTAVTMAGPSQPDEDDYGYVSQEASAFYNKLMDKYSSIPNDEPKFSKKTVSVKDLSSTKDRVRMALLKEEEEEAMGHKRKRRRTKEEMQSSRQDDDDDDNVQYGMPDRGVPEKEARVISSSREKSEPEVKKKKKLQAPPPMDFAELLKVAAQKQFEPIKIEKKEKNDEEDRPMTKKQREEYLREKEYRMRKEEKAAAAKSKEKPSANRSQSVVQVNDSDPRINSTPKMPAVPRIPKVNGAKTNLESQNRMSGNVSEVQNRKSNLSQQASNKETNLSKQKPTEMSKQVSMKSTLSSREQELKTLDEKRSKIQSSKVKDTYSERKPIAQNVPLIKEKRLYADDKKLPTSQPCKPVIKEERRLSNSSSKPVIKEENSLVNNQSLKREVREDKKPGKPSSRPAIKEDRKLPSSELFKVPQKSIKPDIPQTHKHNQSQQQCSKPTPNFVKNIDSKVSKNLPVSRIPPSKGSILKEQLTGMKGDPQKNYQGSNPLVKKDAKNNQPPVKNKTGSAALYTSGGNLKEMPSKSTGSRPLTAAQQGPSREGFRSGPPERRQEIPTKGDIRRPTLMHNRGPPPGNRDYPPNRPKPMHPMDGRKRPAPKRRIESDDEYDSELDDFIDDGPEDSEDYSKYIKEIFGYDKSRYTGTHIHEEIEDDDDDECMESNYAQQMKEEFVSTKIGIMEDLEDIKKEQMEKLKRKKILSSKKRKI